MTQLNRRDTEEILYYTLEKHSANRMQIADGLWNSRNSRWAGGGYYLNPISITRWGHKHGYRVKRVRHKMLWEFNR